MANFSVFSLFSGADTIYFSKELTAKNQNWIEKLIQERRLVAQNCNFELLKFFLLRFDVYFLSIVIDLRSTVPLLLFPSVDAQQHVSPN